MSMTQVESDIADIKTSIALLTEYNETMKDSVRRIEESINSKPSMTSVQLEIQRLISKRAEKCETRTTAIDKKWLIGLLSSSIGAMTMAIIAYFKS